MANAISTIPQSPLRIPHAEERPSAPAEPTCRLIRPDTKEACGEPAKRRVAWGGEDGGTTYACLDCASYQVQRAQEYKCPGHVRILPLRDDLH